MSIPHSVKSSIASQMARVEGAARNVRLALEHNDPDAILRDTQSAVEALKAIQRAIADEPNDGPDSSVFRGDS